MGGVMTADKVRRSGRAGWRTGSDSSCKGAAHRQGARSVTGSMAGLPGRRGRRSELTFDAVQRRRTREEANR